MFRIPLEIQILLSLFAGVFFGLFFGDLAAPLEALGQAYIMLLKMPILLFMSFSLIYSIGNQGKENAQTLFKFGALMLLLVWGITLAVLYLASTSFPSERPPALFSDPLSSQSTETVNLLELFIPLNPVHAFTYEIVPAIVVFSLLFGVMLIGMPNKKDFLKNIQIVISVLESIANWVAKFAPLGVFALIASATGTISLQQFSKIQIYFFSYLMAAIILSLWLFPLLVSVLTKIPKRRFLKELQPALLISFSTGNLLIALPLLIKALSNLTEESHLLDEESKASIDSMIPIAYNFPTSGNLLVFLFILFASFFYSIDLSFTDHLKMIFLGIPSLFGPSTVVINAVNFMCDQLRIPVDSISLFLETMPFTRNFHILTSCAQIATLGLLVTFAIKKRLAFQTKTLILNLIPMVALLLGAGSALKHLQIHDQSLQVYFNQLSIAEKAPNFSYLETPPIQRDPSLPILDQVKKSHTLLIGVNPHIQPFCYLNKKKELVGFDIAMAHKLATDLNVDLVFVPFNFKNLEKDLRERKFDIAMTAISVTENRLSQFLFTQPYNISERVFLTLDYKRHEFKNLSEIKQNSSARFAVFEGSSHEELAKKLFPKAQIIPISDYNQFLAPKLADAVFWTRDEALNWARRYPKFAVVAPTPSVGKESFAYAIPPNATEFKQFLDYWLDIKELDGFIEQQQKMWIKGELPDKTRRWSILKDVLKWIE